MNLDRRDRSEQKIPLDWLHRVEREIRNAENRFALSALEQAEMLAAGKADALYAALDIERQALIGASEMIERRMQAVRLQGAQK